MNGVVEPTHTLVAPDIVPVSATFTVTCVVVVQLPPTVYVILAVPADIAASTPDDAFMVAMAVVPLLHVPPVVALASVVVVP